MTCDDARMEILREIGGEGGDARAHVSTCPACAEYRRDSAQVWDVTGRAVEMMPDRRRARTWSAAGAAAAALIAATSLVAWALRPAGPEAPARQDSDEELLRNDPELRKLVVRTAVQEKERLAEFEKKLSEADKLHAQAKALLDAGKTSDAVTVAETALISFPKLRLVVLDPSKPQYQSTMVKCRLREILLMGQIQLLKAKPQPDDAAGLEERTATEIRLHNQLRETLRHLEKLKVQGPQPCKDAAVELGGAELTLQAETLEKLKSIRITMDFSDATLKKIVGYIRELTGLNCVLTGAGDGPVSIQLQDARLDAVLEHVTKLAGYTFEVDRFGILLFSPAKK